MANQILVIAPYWLAEVETWVFNELCRWVGTGAVCRVEFLR